MYGYSTRKLVLYTVVSGLILSQKFIKYYFFAQETLEDTPNIFRWLLLTENWCESVCLCEMTFAYTTTVQLLITYPAATCFNVRQHFYHVTLPQPPPTSPTVLCYSLCHRANHLPVPCTRSTNTLCFRSVLF